MFLDKNRKTGSLMCFFDLKKRRILSHACWRKIGSVLIIMLLDNCWSYVPNAKAVDRQDFWVLFIFFVLFFLFFLAFCLWLSHDFLVPSACITSSSFFVFFLNCVYSLCQHFNVEVYSCFQSLSTFSCLVWPRHTTPLCPRWMFQPTLKVSTAHAL